MSTRTILAVRTGPAKFKGVFHEQGGEPWVLGDHLLSRIIRARGDLEKVVDETILSVPWGWVNLPRAHKSDLKKKPNRRLFSQNILRKRDEIEMDWLYLFDVDERTLTISAVDDVAASGLDAEPYAVVTFNERGRPSPRQIVPPPPPWPSVPVAEEWEGDLDDLVPLRQRAVDVTDGWCGQVGLPAENLSMLVGAALSSVISKALGAEHENVYVPAPARQGQTYWSVQLYDTTLHYPSPAWRDHLRQTGSMYKGDSFEVWASPKNTATVDFSPRNIVAGYEGFPWSDDLPSQEATVSAVLRGIAAGLFPRSDVDSEGLRIFRWMTVVETVEDPDRQVRVSAQNETEVDSEVQNTLLLKWAWDILDWVRASQLAEGGEDVEYDEDGEEVVYVDEDGEEVVEE